MGVKDCNVVAVTDLADRKERRMDGGDSVAFGCTCRQGKGKITAGCSLHGVGSGGGDEDAIRCRLFVQEGCVFVAKS